MTTTLITADAIWTKPGKLLSPGFIVTQDSKISYVDSKPPPSSFTIDKTIELKNTLLLPGFVNAHCHLELTHLGPLEQEKQFVGWIKNLVSQKNQSAESEVRKGIKKGIDDLTKSGVTCIGDHISFNTPWEEIINSRLKGRLFGEVLGVIPEVARDIYAHFKKMKAALKKRSSQFELNISPHAIHSVHPEILDEVLNNEPAPLSCHIAESKEEEEYFFKQSGPMADLIRSRGDQQLERVLPLVTPKICEQQILGDPHSRHPFQLVKNYHKFLLIHGNHLSDADITLIAQNNISVVHCPGSHSFFGHKPFPLKKLLDQNVNIALGTDSLASNTSLNFLDELRLLKKTFPELTQEEILGIATINGAKALRMEDQIGTLEIGKKADIAGFKLIQDPFTSVMQASEVSFQMFNGLLT